MNFALSKLAIAILSPLGTSLLLGALALALLVVFKRPRLGALIGGLALGWLMLWSTPLVSHALRSSLEAAYPPLPLSAVPQAQAIVVLGGVISPPGPGRPWPDLNQAADRLWHAARLLRAGKAPLIVLSGGPGADAAALPGTGGQGTEGQGVSEAAAMRQFLLEWQVPQASLLLEERSRNTAENARYTQQLLAARGIRRVLLVTSALHMARAMAHFQAVGLEVLPAATDHEARDTATWPWWQRWLPDADALDGSARAIKEWVGRLVLGA